LELLDLQKALEIWPFSVFGPNAHENGIEGRGEDGIVSDAISIVAFGIGPENFLKKPKTAMNAAAPEREAAPE
jgi:hypothetical protein